MRPSRRGLFSPLASSESPGGGSLWVHKATHHFDLINWWLSADPTEVSAYGKLNVYGKNGAFRAANCRVCPHKKDCRFYYDLEHQPDAHAGCTPARKTRTATIRDGVRVPERHRHLRFDAGDREVFERRDDGVFAGRAYAVRRLPRGVQRRARPSRSARPRAAAVGTCRKPTRPRYM